MLWFDCCYLLVFFRMESSSPGKVYLRRYATDPETSIDVLKDKNKRFSKLCSILPEVLPVKGLDPHRQWYLYEEVAPYCANPKVCPKPDCPKPSIKIECDSTNTSNEKRRKCSHCKKEGHCRVKSGKIMCPDLMEK